MIYCEAGKFIIAFAFTKPVGGYIKPAECGKSVHIPVRGDGSECIMGATRLLMMDDMYKINLKTGRNGK